MSIRAHWISIKMKKELWAALNQFSILGIVTSSSVSLDGNIVYNNQQTGKSIINYHWAIGSTTFAVIYQPWNCAYFLGRDAWAMD